MPSIWDQLYGPYAPDYGYPPSLSGPAYDWSMPQLPPMVSPSHPPLPPPPMPRPTMQQLLGFGGKMGQPSMAPDLVPPSTPITGAPGMPTLSPDAPVAKPYLPPGPPPPSVSQLEPPKAAADLPPPPTGPVR